MDVNFMQEQLPLYVEAAKLTLHMAVWGILFSILKNLRCIGKKTGELGGRYVRGNIRGRTLKKILYSGETDIG